MYLRNTVCFLKYLILAYSQITFLSILSSINCSHFKKLMITTEHTMLMLLSLLSGSHSGTTQRDCSSDSALL